MSHTRTADARAHSSIAHTFRGITHKIPAWVRTLEFALVTIALLAGTAFVAITPPFQNPDEAPHFYRAMQVADGGMLSVENKPGQGDANDRSIGGEVLLDAQSLVTASGFETGFDETSKFSDLDHEALSQYRFGGESEYRRFDNTAAYPPLAYLPTSAAVLVGKTLNLPLLSALYLGRMFSLLASVALLFLALRTAPFARWAILTLALLPSTISQAASFGADGMTIGVCFAAVAYVIRLATQDAAVRPAQWALMTGLGASIALVKPTYIPLGLLLALVPILNKHARSATAWVGLVIAGGVGAALTLGWQRINAFVDIGVNPANNMYDQRDFVLSHPVAFVKAVAQTLFLDPPNGLTNQKGDLYRGIFGDFAWLRTPLPMFFVLALTVALTLSLVVTSRGDRILVPAGRNRLWWTLILGAALVATVLLVALALYLYFTPTAGPAVQGLQGRYFLPMVLLLAFLCVGGRLVSQRPAKITIVVVLVASLVVSVYVLVLRYYVVLPAALQW